MSIAALRDENEQLKAPLAQTQAALSEHQGRWRRRRKHGVGWRSSSANCEKFGAKSEKLRPDQYHLPQEDVEIAGHPGRGAGESRGCDQGPIAERAGSRLSSQSRLLACPFAACGTDHRACEHALSVRLRRHDEDRQGPSKRLDVIPAQWRGLVTRGPKYICRYCSGPVVQAHAPEHVVPSGLPTEAAIAHVIVSKFGGHTPFYRQAEIYARQGIRPDRATLGNWSGRACFHLQPIADHMRRRLAMADRLFMDETTAPVLDPGRGQTKKNYFWAIVSDDRGHGGPSPPIVLFRYVPGRSGAFAEQFLDGFCRRFLQCDAYDGYDRLTEVARPQGPWTLVHCWSHLRRRFVKLVRNSKSPIAEAAVRHIAQLYDIEAMVRGASPDIRLARRREHSLPMVAALKPWFEKQLSMISSGSTLAEDIRYALNHWQGLTRFLEDGRLELDTNPVENANPASLSDQKECSLRRP